MFSTNTARRYFYQSILKVQKFQQQNAPNLFSRNVATSFLKGQSFLEKPQGKMVVFALCSGVAGTSLLYFVSKTPEGKSMLYKATGGTLVR